MAKYDFPNIRRVGGASLRLVLSQIPALKWVPNFVLTFVSEIVVGWATNKGLIILNIGAIVVEGEINQKEFDKAMESALEEVESKEGKLTSEEIKRIDGEVIRLARKHLRITRA